MALLNRRTLKSLGIGLVGLLVGGGTAWGQAPLLTLGPSNLRPGDTSQGFISFACYDLFTLMPINCEVTATLAPLDPATTTPPFFGGHVDHNTALQPVGTVRDANIPGAGDVSVTGETINGFAVAYKAPDASGEVQFVTTWTPPPSWVCQDNNEGNLGGFRRPCTGTNHFNIGFPLQPLDPLDYIFYKVVRGDTDRHPDGTFGTVDTTNKLKSIAGLFSNWTFDGERLSINDVSLPQGGLFDVAAASEWAPPHKTHRRGTEADINEAAVDVNGTALQPVPCPDDYALQLAIEEVANGASRPQLICENNNGKPDPNGPRKHINF